MIGCSYSWFSYLYSICLLLFHFSLDFPSYYYIQFSSVAQTCQALCDTMNYNILLQEGGPLPGPETGLLSNTRKWIVWGGTCAKKARDFIGKGHPGGEQEGKGTQENCSAAWLAVLGFMVMWLAPGWSSANHYNSESFLVAHASLSQDGC